MTEIAADQARAIAALQAELAELRAEVATLRRATVPPAPADGPARAPAGERSTAGGADRRTFLRGGALAAGAVVSAAAGSVAGAAPAAAADGDPILAGQANSATSSTTVFVDLPDDPATPYGVMVNDAVEVTFGLLAPAALIGYAGDESFRIGLQGVGEGPDTFGVFGRAVGSNSVGVGGQGAEFGLYGLSPLIGVRAESDGGIGLAATADGEAGIGIDVRGEKATMMLRGVSGFPPNSTAAHEAGELAVIESGGSAELYFCTQSGTPGRWARLAGGESAGSLALLGNATRIYDSRPGNPPDTGPKTKLTGDGSPRTITVAGLDMVPGGATGLLLNLTVVNTSSGGFVALHKGGTDWQGNSNINWTAPNTVIANSAVVAIDGTLSFRATCAPGASTDIIVDLVGYFR